MGFVFLFFAFLLSSYEATKMAERVFLLTKSMQATEELGRLQRATIRGFHDKKPPAETEFWTEVKRADPLKDPWGMPYRLAKIGEDLVWVSAGPDRILSSKDDLAKYILVRDGVIVYLENTIDEPPLGTRVMDAK